MCPDDSLLSAYYDGELVHPWEKKMEDHLQNCPSCRAKLDIWRTQSALLQNDPEPEFPSSLEDITRIIRHGRNIQSGRILPSRLPVLPLAAAAAAILAFFLGFLVAGTPKTGSSPMDMPMAVSEGWFMPSGDLLVSGEADVEAILSLFNQSQSSMFNQETSMDLPGDLNLALIGDSQLVRTAAYSGSPSR